MTWITQNGEHLRITRLNWYMNKAGSAYGSYCVEGLWIWHCSSAAGGVVCAGGVGFDISCGVRTLHAGLGEHDIARVQHELADALYSDVPVRVGSTSAIRLRGAWMDAMLRGGAQWAIEEGYGDPADLERIEGHGRMAGAEPDAVSEKAKRRQRDEMGTLGSGNHYLEVQRVATVYQPEIASGFGLAKGDVVVSIHCGSRGLGHQIGTGLLGQMANAAKSLGIALPDPELACAPIVSPVGQAYLGTMRAAINCALANRQIITHLTRGTFARVLPGARMTLLYDVSHNTCKPELHDVCGVTRSLYVHCKGATSALGPHDPDIPEALRPYGQPVLIGGSMGTASYILAGAAGNQARAFSSACHGAGRAMSRHAATRRWRGRSVVDELERRHVLVRSPSLRGIAEEAPGAYKDVDAVVDVAEQAGLARKVVRLEPLICVKG